MEWIFLGYYIIAFAFLIWVTWYRKEQMVVELDVISWIWIVGYFAIAIALLIWMLKLMWKDIFPKVKVSKPNKKIFNWKA